MGQGESGFFWAPTWYNTYRMRVLYMGTSNIDPSDYNIWYYGFSVRCIVK